MSATVLAWTMLTCAPSTVGVTYCATLPATTTLAVVPSNVTLTVLSSTLLLSTYMRVISLVANVLPKMVSDVPLLYVMSPACADGMA